MRVQVISEISSAKGIIPVGQIIEVSPELLGKLGRKVELINPAPNGGRSLPHYCQAGDCWCSEKLPGRDYPNGCIRANCEHYLGGDHAKEG